MEAPRPVDWRPYRATGVALAVALGLNVWTGNGLWAAYTLTGSGVFLGLVGAVRTWHWRPPTGAVWMAGLAAALHYVGGSLSGLHTIGGPNGLYYAFPWWDNLTHTLGAAAVAVVAYATLRARLPQAGRLLLGIAAVAFAAFVGTLVELYEFTQFVVFHTVDQGYYTNNMLDLYYNLLGGVVGALGYGRYEVRLADRVLVGTMANTRGSA